MSVPPVSPSSVLRYDSVVHLTQYFRANGATTSPKTLTASWKEAFAEGVLYRELCRQVRTSYSRARDKRVRARPGRALLTGFRDARSVEDCSAISPGDAFVRKPDVSILIQIDEGQLAPVRRRDTPGRKRRGAPQQCSVVAGIQEV